MRIERDHLDGRITPEQWNRLGSKLTEELDGPRAALLRAREHVVHVEGNQSLPDGEETLLRHLSSLRAAVTEGIGQAPDINGLRTILRDMFQHIELIASPGYGT